MPAKRLINTSDVDFPGSDLQSIFDTDLESCQRACLNDALCQAFTFNARSGSCFPKSALNDRAEYSGAISGEVVTIHPAAMDLAQTRAAEIDFMSTSDFAQARSQTQSLGADLFAGNMSYDEALDDYSYSRKVGDLTGARRSLGRAVANSENADLWREFADLTREIVAQDENDNRDLRESLLATALNAYLRQDNAADQREALITLARSLELRGRGRDQIPALRLADDLSSTRETAQLLARAQGLFGFNIVDNRVESDIAVPRVCVEFNGDLAAAGVDYSNYISLPESTLAVTAQDRSLCVEGVEHGARYAITFRKGLPAQSGEKLAQDSTINVYIRDRSPQVTFPGRTYVLPRMPGAGLPIETVNLDSVDLVLRRVSDRNLVAALRDDYFGRPLSYYQDRNFESSYAEEIWRGVGNVQNTINKTMVTRLPLDGPLKELEPGIYALKASIAGADPYDTDAATQWFVVSDLALTSLSGTDGLHVYVRGLNDALAKKGLTVDLISRANEVISTAKTDAQGAVLFSAGLTQGKDQSAPAMLIARDADAEDMVFLSLTDPAFDLSDRGVEGMPPAPPIDVFMGTDRGAYRPGETIRVTALMRNSEVESLNNLPLTAILKRPDGVEYARRLSGNDLAGGHVFNLPLGTDVARGTWRIELRSDLDAPALAADSVLVEDFLPERIDFVQTLPDGPIRAGDTPPLSIDARYLFGAPAGDLNVEGTVRVSAAKGLDDWPGYHFGRFDEPVSAQTTGFGNGVTTDERGQAQIPLELPMPDAADVPLEATITTRIAEGSGRPVERQIIRALALSQPVIGLRAMFDGLVGEGSEASFNVIALGSDETAQPMDVQWTVNRLERNYQWYQIDGNWDWDVTTTRERVAGGEVTTGAQPFAISAPVEWGEYELIVETTSGNYTSSSYAFEAGWYAPAGADSPDTLDMSLDRETYSAGDTAKLRLVSRFDGTALIAVMSNRLIATKSVKISKGENNIPVEVTKDWGTGAYVTVQAIRPMDVAAGMNPARGLGLVYAAIAPADRELVVSIDAAEIIAPRGPMPVRVFVEGAKGKAYVTLAAVDLGILNLTGFNSPDPTAHYFGQRRLGVEIRDLYGRLIDGMNGAVGTIRSGGDASGGMGREAPPPTEDLVAYFSGPIEIGADGTAKIDFDLPSFNGTVRLMAIAWSDTAVGEAERDVIVRDPVVVTASLPRFLAPNDEAQMLLEFVHTEGPAGDMALSVTAPGLSLGAGYPDTVTLSEQGKTDLRIPVVAREAGDYEITVSLTPPGGAPLIKTLRMPVRVNDPQIAQTRRFTLAADDTFTLTDAVFSDFRQGTGTAVLTAGPLAKLDVAGLLQSLDTYPYGCTEQLTSRAMPMLYFDEVAQKMGIAQGDDMSERLEKAVRQILTRQDTNGAFGLWDPSSGDFWLDAYVGDFLSRAKVKGIDVPDSAFRSAMDNLRNQLSYASDFEADTNGGGTAVAYASMVLAREGAARIGDLRYYADEKAEDFGTPLAQAQLGAALAFYGDQPRADKLFKLAARGVADQSFQNERQRWRDDYGSNLRDAAGVLSLASAAGSNMVDREALTMLIASPERHRSTQEMTWGLLAAQGLLNDANAAMTLNGTPVTGALVERVEDTGDVAPMAIGNASDQPTDITLTTFGVPLGDVDASGYNYAISRSYFTPEGVPIDGIVTQGTRLVVVLDIAASEDAGGRLMIDDPLPAGLEIDNPHLITSGEMKDMEWLETAYAEHAEFRSDRFIAQVNRSDGAPFRIAYVVRAITPGEYHHPAASVEDMYRPQNAAHTASGRFVVVE
jgi:uncharacterized protein YfaS (alpha-2-macroglobulin family)